MALGHLLDHLWDQLLVSGIRKMQAIYHLHNIKLVLWLTAITTVLRSSLGSKHQDDNVKNSLILILTTQWVMWWQPPPSFIYSLWYYMTAWG